MPRPLGPPCSVCGEKSSARGLCVKHYTKLRAYGDPNAPDHRRKGTPAERFWRYVEKSDGCWLWIGRLNHAGYGSFGGSRSNTVRAHRFSYEITYGVIPDGLTIDHLCRNRACVRPDHLEAVTHLENVRRSGPATREVCPKGHRMSKDNIRRRSTGGRTCRECALAAQRAYRKRLRARGEPVR